MSRKGDEAELLLISQAVACLEWGMFGNLKPTEAVNEAKKHFPKAKVSVGPGPQKEHAAKFIDNVVMKGELSVFVLPDSTEGDAGRTPLQVPPDVIMKMIRTRGGLPDHAVQPARIFAKEANPLELRTALSKSALYVRRQEFDDWYKKAWKKRNWPSQRSSLKPRMGRPSKQSELHTRIIARVNEGRWSARNSIADLVRLLDSKGIVASRDTVRRAVDQLFKETGEQSYRRLARNRSKLAQKSG
jgi:hypothetical protein